VRRAEQRAAAALKKRSKYLVEHGTNKAGTNPFHGVGVAVWHDGQEVAAFALGETTRGKPLTTSSRFRIASVSKVLLATLVMQLVEQRTLSLDGTLAHQWTGTLEGSDPRVRKITVRQLLQHTSGLGILRPVFFNNGSSDWHRSASLALQSTLTGEPGTKYAYSNANFVVLGDLVERITGKRIVDLINDRVLAPLGIEPSGFAPTRVTDHSGPAYRVTPGRQYMEALGPAGAWTLSPSEVARVLTALDPHGPATLLTEQSRLLMQPPCVHDPHPDGQDDNERYGLGLRARYDRRSGLEIWGHTGTIEGALASAFVLPNGYVFVVLAATESPSSGERLLTTFADQIEVLSEVPASAAETATCPAG
jgi:D-alanyl-D-alanine carboxypeptidase